MSRVTVNEQYLQDTADAIRAKTGQIGTYKPSQFADVINEISTGGEKQLYIFTQATYLNTDVGIGTTYFLPKAAYFNSDIVEGATINFKTYNDYILNNITGQESGNIIPFTTVSRGNYTFVMPNESVYCTLIYDD